MKTRYLVKEVNGCRYLDSKALPTTKWAVKIRTEYGLYMYSVAEVFHTWTNFSIDKYKVNWLKPCKKTVQDAFGVVLIDKN
jgi:hypothetical protein